MWKKTAQNLNECTVLRFSVGSDRFTLGFLVRKQKRKIRAKKKSSGIAPDEPSELKNLLKTIIALEEGANAESQELKAEKCEQIKTTEQRQKMRD